MAEEKHDLPPFEAKDELEQAIYDTLVRVGAIDKMKYDLETARADRAYNRYKKRQKQEKALAEAIEDNIVKQVCRELGITQRELAERIGMSADSLRTLSAKGQISTQTEAAINLVLENENLKKELENYKALRTAIKTMID